MRKILFKAKRYNDDYTAATEWCFGYPVRRVDCAGSVWIMEVPPKDPDDRYHEYCIDENTLCEYTGFDDKNGKPIFEGDIVRGKADYGIPIYAAINFDNAFIAFMEGAFGISVKENENMTIFRPIHCFEKYSLGIEVVGNIHDVQESEETT